MEYNKQSLQGTDVGIFNAIKYGNRIYYSGASPISPIASTKTGYDTNGQQRKLVPVFEVTVIDPNHLYSSDDDDREDCVDNKAKSNETEGSAEKSTVEAHPVEPTDIDQPVNLFDFDVLNIADDIILPETDFFEDCTDKFDLGSYLIEKRTSLVLPAIIQQTPVKTTDDGGSNKNKDVLEPIAAHNTDIALHNTTGLNFWKRKNEQRNYVDTSSDSDDDKLTRKTKKRKGDDDPSWNPVTDRKTKKNKNVACNMAMANEKSSHASEVPDPSNADKPKVCTVNGLKFGIGRGKDFASLVNLYKPSSDKLIIKKTDVVDIKLESDDSRKSMTSMNSKSQKVKKNKISKDNVKENDPLRNTSDESDFAKFVRSTIKIRPRTKSKPPTTSTKRNKLEIQNQLKQYPERLQILHKFKTVLNERTAQPSQIVKPTVHQMAGDNQTTEKPTENLPQSQQQLMENEIAEPVKKRSISVQEYLARRSVEMPPDQAKRKITIQEYLKRKATT